MTYLHLSVVMLLGIALPIVVCANNASFSFVLPNEDVGSKIVVAEFLDPGGTGLGKAVSYIIWHELLTAISKSRDDVILVRAASIQGGLEQLQAERHEAALKMAQQYQAPVVLWGEVNKRVEGGYWVKTFLTLNPKVRDGNLALGLSVSHEEGIWKFQAKMPRTRFEFASVNVNRSELFARRLLTHTSAPLRSAPSASAPVMAEMPADMVLEATDMQDSWFMVQSAGGANAYIEDHDVEVLPQRVVSAQRQVPLRDGPGLMYENQEQVNLQGEFSVLDRQYRFGQGLWYRLQVGNQIGWVQGHMLQPQFILPVEHFIVGLSDYRGKRYESAHRELTRFTNTPNAESNNATLAVAYQLQGASRLSFYTPFDAVDQGDLSAFTKAIDLTPYDPAAYNLRALAMFGTIRRLDDVFADLKKALDLAPEDVQVRAFINTLVDVAESSVIDLPDLEWLAAYTHVERVRLGPHQRLQENATEIGPYTVGEGCVITVENQTPVALRLYVVGPVSRIVELPQGQSKDIDLIKGKYALAAEFASAVQGKPSQVRPMYGLQTYQPKTHYTLKFYVQWRHNR